MKTDAPGLSHEFATRLARVPAGRTVRAIVVLAHAPTDAPAVARRRSTAERAKFLEKTRRSTRGVIIELDRVLARVGGKRLADQIDALNCVPVETTARGVRELATQSWAKAVLEDQPLTALGVR